MWRVTYFLYTLTSIETVLQDDVLKNIVCLHAMVVGADIIANCCLESSIVYVTSLYEKYKCLVGGNYSFSNITSENWAYAYLSDWFIIM